MAELDNKTQFLPNEILAKIFSHLDYNTVRKINKDWKLFIEQNNLYFDLIKVKDKILKQKNILSLNINCSQIYDKIPSKSSNSVLPNEDKILKSLIKKLNIIKKNPSIKIINIKIDLIYLSNDSFKIKYYTNFPKENLSTTNMGFNTLGVFCIKHLLKSNAKIFKLVINNNYENPEDRYNAIKYEYDLVNYLIDNGYKYDLFIYKGSLKMFFIYDAKTNTFVYRTATSKSHYHYITARKLNKYKLDNLFICHDYIDDRFKWSRRFSHPLNMKFILFVDDIYKLLKLNKKNVNSVKDLFSIFNRVDNDLDIIKLEIRAIRRAIKPFDIIFVQDHENYTIDKFLNESFFEMCKLHKNYFLINS